MGEDAKTAGALRSLRDGADAAPHAPRRIQTQMNPAELESYIRSVAPEFGLDPELCVRQCMAESSLGRNLHPSSAGARGVMQLMPIALADLAKRFHFICD